MKILQLGDRLYPLGNGQIEVVRRDRVVGLITGHLRLIKDAGEPKSKQIPPGAKWITVNPNDSGTGVPVLIQEHPDGSASVIGGAGGKLNQLHLSRLRSPEEWREKAEEKKQKKAEKEQKRLEGMSEEEKAAEKEKKAKLKEYTRTKKHENAVATLEAMEKAGLDHGLSEEHKEALRNPPTEAASDAEIKDWKAKTAEAVKLARKVQSAYEHKLVTDHDARAAAMLGESPLHDTENRVVVGRTHEAYSDSGDAIASLHQRPDGKWVARTSDPDQPDRVFSSWKEAAKAHVGNVALADQSAGGLRSQPEDFYDPSQWVKEQELPEGIEFSTTAAKEIAALAAQRKADEKNAKFAEKAIEKRLPFQPGYDVGESSAPSEDEIFKGLEDRAKTLDDAIANNDLLSLVGAQDPKRLAGHVTTGGYSALATLASEVLKVNPVNVSVVEALGHNEAAKILAYQMRENLTSVEYDRAARALAAKHGRESGEIAKQVADDVRPDLDRLKEVHDQIFELEQMSGGDYSPEEQIVLDNLAYEARSLNDSIEKRLGSAIGELQATAALVAALEGSPKSLRFLGSGDLKSVADLVPQFWGDRAEDDDSPEGTLFDRYGLSPDDFELLDAGGDKQSIEIKESGLKKLAHAPSIAEDRAAYEAAIAIKRGDMDEEDFTPDGFAYRAKLTYDGKSPIPSADMAKEAQQFGTKFEAKSGDSDEQVAEHLRNYIGAMVANGHGAMDVFRAIHSAEFANEVDDPEQVGRVIGQFDQQFFQASEKGDFIDESLVQKSFRDLAEHEAARQRSQGLTPNTEAFHKQTIQDEGAAIEAAHRVMSSMPMARVAFKEQLTRAERQWLRDYAVTEIMGETLKDKPKKEDIEGDSAQEVVEEGLGLFGDMDFGGGAPQLADWEKKAAEKLGLSEEEYIEQRSQADKEGRDDSGGGGSDGSDRPKTQWDEFVSMFGGSERDAIKAVRDKIRGQFYHKFSKAYNTLSDSPLLVSEQEMTGAKGLMRAAMSPDDRDRHDKEMREMRARQVVKLRSRDAKGRLQAEQEDWLNVAENFKASAGNRQAALFNMAAVGEQKSEESDRQGKLLESGGKQSNRLTLGESAEKQLHEEVLSKVLPNFEQVSSPVDLYPEIRLNGQHVVKQRVLKLLMAQKKIGMHLGAGSGKTSQMLGAFSHLHSKGEVKRSLVAVPSSIVGQFMGEAATFLEAGSYNYNANLGWNREQRIAALRGEGGNHLHVTTRESLTNDLMHLIEKHTGVNAEQYAREPGKKDDTGQDLPGTSEEERRSLLLTALQKEGIDPSDLLFSTDEAHDISRRKGATASKRSLVLDALAYHSKYHISATATPVKNDLSELYSFLHTVAPHKFDSEKAFMAAYGGNSDASQRALQRAIAPYAFASSVRPFVKQKNEDGTETIRDLQMRESQPTIAPSEYQTQRRKEIGDAAKKLSDWYKAQVPKIQAKIASETPEQAGRGLKGEDFAHAWDEPELRDAIASLADPESYAKLTDEEKRAKIGGQVMASGAMKNVAMWRTIHRAPFEHNPKAQHTVEHMQKMVEQGKPGIVFCTSSQAAEMLRDEMKKRGLRVGYIDGKMSSQQKDAERLKFSPDGGAEAQTDILVATEAASTGLNLTRGKVLMHFDAPMTKKAYTQRSARIFRLKQNEDVDIITPLVDLPEERQAWARIQRKGKLGAIVESKTEALDDSGLAGEIERLRLMEETPNAA